MFCLKWEIFYDTDNAFINNTLFGNFVKAGVQTKLPKPHLNFGF